jgi:predicted Zn-dependent peptidase
MTPEYGNRDVLRILQVGTRFRLYQAADHLRIGLTVDPSDLVSGLNLMRSVLTNPTFLQDTIKVRRSLIQTPWAPAYRGFEVQETPLVREEVVGLWRAVMRPQNIMVAISGRFRANDPSEKWRSMQSGWIYNIPNQLPLAYPPKLKETPNSPPILIFDSKPISITRTSLASYLMAANALGIGKESVQWLVAREELNISYRQEAFLVPTTTGWRFRMAFATDAAGTKPESISNLRTKLRTRCEKLTQQDLLHAIGLGKGYLANQLPNLPLVLGIGEVLSGDANDDLYLRHYFKTMFGFEFNAESLLLQMKGTSLEELKKTVLQLIDESDVRIL